MAASTPCAITRHVSRYLGAEPGTIRADVLAGWDAARAEVARAEAEAKVRADAEAAVKANQRAAARFALTGQVAR